MSDDQSAPHEIVIVRRRGGDGEEGHHGGVWKIAYADFMTAMMAFFLVMWLVNAADKKVLTQVATYFNPLRMSDRVTADKGLDDMTEGLESSDKADAEDGKKAKPKKAAPEKAGGHDSEPHEEAAGSGQGGGAATGGSQRFTDQQALADPYSVLQTLSEQAIAEPVDGADPEPGQEPAAPGPDAMRDPFEPAIKGPRAPESPRSAGEAQERVDAAVAPTPSTGKPAPTVGAAAVPGAASAKPPSAKPEQADIAAAEKASAALEADLKHALAAFAAGKRPDVSVKATPEGLLISLTDEFDFGMFASASAVPNPQLVVALKSLAPVIGKTPGQIIVRGHTDAQPFKKGRSDNWRLSADRALMTRHMLIFGGIAQTRFEHVEGYADTKLMVTDNPLAAQNRRIEILLRPQGKG